MLSLVPSQTLTSSLSKNLRSDPAEGRDEVVVKSRSEREESGVSMLERQACRRGQVRKVAQISSNYPGTLRT